MLDKMSPIKNYRRHILSLLCKSERSRRAIQQLHSHFTVISIGGDFDALHLWNSIIKHYSLLSSLPHEAISLFNYLKKRRTACRPLSFDSFTYAYLVKACANMDSPRVGSQLHSLVTRAGYDRHVHVGTAMVNMYADCRCLSDARKVFDEMPDRNNVTWNVLLAGFVKWGEIEKARRAFDEMPAKNVISWTCFIDGQTRAGQFFKALSTFRTMVVDKGIRPTNVTLLSIFPSIWNLGSLELCETVHSLYGTKHGLITSDVRIANCFVDAYAKCGNLTSASKLFQEDIDEKQRNLITWTSIISAFAMHGMAQQASDHYQWMENEGIEPNWITFLSVLSACSHGGLVDEGLKYYRRMVDEHGIKPNVKHYGCLIDMLGRSGRLDEAENIALTLPEGRHGNNDAGVIAWRMLLGACSFHGDVERGKRVMAKIMSMEKRYGGDYVLLANIYSGVGSFMESEMVRGVMDMRRASRIPGLTVI